MKQVVSLLWSRAFAVRPTKAESVDLTLAYVEWVNGLQPRACSSRLSSVEGHASSAHPAVAIALSKRPKIGTVADSPGWHCAPNLEAAVGRYLDRMDAFQAMCDGNPALRLSGNVWQCVISGRFLRTESEADAMFDAGTMRLLADGAIDGITYRPDERRGVIALVLSERAVSDVRFVRRVEARSNAPRRLVEPEPLAGDSSYADILGLLDSIGAPAQSRQTSS